MAGATGRGQESSEGVGQCWSMVLVWDCIAGATLLLCDTLCNQCVPSVICTMVLNGAGVGLYSRRSAFFV